MGIMKTAGTILILLLVTGEAFSQLININNVSDLEFGVVQQASNGSASATIEPQFGAQFNITGLSLLGFSVTLSTANLVLTGGTGVSVGTWRLHATNTQTYSSGPNILSTETTGSTTLSLLGAKTLWLGGTLTAAPSAEPGSYSGTINIEVAYF